MHRVFEYHTLKCFTRPPVSKKESCSLHVWAQKARQTGLETRPNSLTKRLSELFFDCYYVGSSPLCRILENEFLNFDEKEWN